jgi:hypothetical protein
MTFRVRDLMAGVLQGKDEDEQDRTCHAAQDSCGRCTDPPCYKTKKPEKPDKAVSLSVLRTALRQSLAQG